MPLAEYMAVLQAKAAQVLRTEAKWATAHPTPSPYSPYSSGDGARGGSAGGSSGGVRGLRYSSGESPPGSQAQLEDEMFAGFALVDDGPSGALRLSDGQSPAATSPASPTSITSPETT